MLRRPVRNLVLLTIAFPLAWVIAGFVELTLDRKSGAFLSLMLMLILFGFYLTAVYELHGIVGEQTAGEYFIKPWPAVVYHFIPLFGWYWALRWNYRMARYIQRPNAGTPHPILIVAGLLLLLVLIPFAGKWILGSGLSLLVLYYHGRLMSGGIVPGPENIHFMRDRALHRGPDMVNRMTAEAVCLAVVIPIIMSPPDVVTMLVKSLAFLGLSALPVWLFLRAPAIRRSDARRRRIGAGALAFLIAFGLELFWWWVEN